MTQPPEHPRADDSSAGALPEPPPHGYSTPPPHPSPPPSAGFPGAPTANATGNGYGQAPVGVTPPGQLGPQDERTWGMLAHLSALLASFVALAFLGPLLVMLIQGPKSAFVRRQAVEALNFQITTYIAGFIAAILIFVLVGFILLPIVGIAWLVLTILAAVAANRGEDYRYPINLRLVK